MKPFRWILTALCFVPAVAPLLSATADDAPGTTSTDVLLASLPSPVGTAWVQVRDSSTVEELSLQLGLDETRLALLNKVDEDHRFNQGDWLALPSLKVNQLDRIASLDASAQRLTPPQQLVASAPMTSSGVVRFGDNLVKIAQRYGLTLAELLRLNPGLETARLVVGSQVRLAQSSSLVRTRSLLAVNPVGSGGASWPDLPSFGESPVNPSRNGDSTSFIWPAQGVFTSGYGWRWGRMHKGIDVANNVGTPIVAVQDGRVEYAGWDDGGYGYLVRIQHGDGTLSVYGHNSRILVREGEVVRQGQTISHMGSTGRSTGPHLHFELRPPGQGAINPLALLPPRA